MGFSFLQLILLSDAQGGVLLHILGVSIEDGLQDVGDKLLHLPKPPKKRNIYILFINIRRHKL